MNIQIIDHVVFADYNELQVDNTLVNQIVNHTAETWQPDRESSERGRNTRQGKIAEEIVEAFLKNHFGTEISVKSYDEIRSDNYEKHAPFDFLIWEAGKADITPVENAVRNDIASAQGQVVRLSGTTRSLCRDLNIKIAEVKSTKVRGSLKEQACFAGDYGDIESVRRLVNTIKRTDDVFCYPYYKRSEINNNYSMDDYCRYVKSVEHSLEGYEGEKLRKKVIDIEAEKQCCDVFIRVYVDPGAKKGFIIGWMSKERLLDDAVLFKRMPQRSKSERALYFVKNLQETESPERIPIVFER